MPASPIPPGYHTATPYLIVAGAAAALAFYAKAFGARELFRLPAPSGRIGHAEFEIGDCRLMIADENPEHQARGPQAFGGSPISMLLYLPEVDAVTAQAAAAGAEIITPPEDKFYGDRMSTIRDPFGHTWHLATHIEDLTPDEIERRMRALTT